MKRVLTALLLIALVVTCFAFASCGGNGEAHVHTFKDTWSNDASGHWYEPTCECTEDLRVVLAHVDNNNDGACDICTYTDHQHTYSEGYTADCTNHWNAADCGHTVAGANVEAHIDETGDGVCDVCKYVIEDLHEHIYSAEWDGDGEYHWHNAICEHKVEVSGKEGHIINDAGYCTVCNKQIKEVDKTDILAVLKAAIANNYKVVTGTVIADEMVYGAGAALETGKTNKVFFVLGNGDSYVEWGSYNKTGEFTGVDEYYQETLENGTIFAVQIPYYDGNKRNDELKMFPVDGDPMKLNGYNYTPGAILAAYDDTETLAQTIANLYDILVKNVNVSNPQSGYDAETGKYTFSYGYFSVNETSGSTSLDGTGEDVVSYYVEYYDVKVEFTVDENLVINNATFSVDSYRNLEGVDEDLEYDPVENKVTFLPGKSATTYTYTVAQTSGERTYTTIYPKASLIPQGFDLLTGTPVKDPDTLSTIGFTDKKPLGDKLVINKKVYTYIVLGDPYPITSSFSFLNTEDISVSWVNNTQGSSGAMATMEPYFNWSAGYIAFFPKDDGSYTLTIKIGDVTKSIIVEIGEADLVAPDDTDDTKYVVVKDPNGWDAEYTYEAKESGTYTFTIPANLGFVIKDAQTPVADPFDPEYEAKEYTYEVDLAKGEKLTFNVGAEQKGVFAIGVAFVAGEVVGPGEGGEGGDNPPAEEIDIIGTYTNGKDLTVVIDETTVTYTKGTYSITCDYKIENGAVVLYKTGTEEQWSTMYYAVKVSDGKVSSVVYNGNPYAVTPVSEPDEPDEPENPEDQLQGSGTENDPYVITAGDYVAPFKGGSNLVYYSFTTTESGFVTLKSTFDGTPWLYLGAVSNEGATDTLTAYVPAGGTIIMKVGDWDDQADDVPFTVSFEAKASDDFSALVGTWYGASEGWTTVYYTLVINADGTGSISHDMGYGETTFNVEYVYVEGQNVTIGYKSSYGLAAIECTYDGTTFACTNGVMQDSFTFTNEKPVEETPVYDTIIVEGENSLWFSEEEIAADAATRPLTITEASNYKFASGSLFINKITNANGDEIAKNEDYTFTLEAGDYTVTFTMLSMFGVTADVKQELNVEAVAQSGDTAEVVGYDKKQDNGYNLMIYENGVGGDYTAWFYDDKNVSLFFSVVATANGDGSYTLALEYVSNPDYESGTDKVEEILADTYIITPDSGEVEEPTGVDALVNTDVEGGLNGYNVGFIYDFDAGVYYLNVYGGTQDLYYTAIPTENADGTISLALTLCEDYWMYTGVVTDEYELTGKTVVATPADGTWTFAVESEEEPEEPDVDEPTFEGEGTYESPYVIGEVGSYEAPYAGGYEFPYFQFTVTENGYVTISSTYENFNLQYGTVADVPYNNEGPDGKLNEVKIYALAGSTVYFTVADSNFPEEAVNVPFTVAFESFVSESQEFLKGTWSGVYEDMMGTTPYTFVFGTDGTGTGSYVEWNQTTKFTIDYTLVDGNNVTVKITTSGWWAEEKIFEFTYDKNTDTLSGAMTLEKLQLIDLGSMSINGTAQNGTYTYIASEAINIEISIGGKLGSGSVTITYSINGGAEMTAAISSTSLVELDAGDKLTITINVSDSRTYSSISLTKVYPLGSKQNPFIIDTLPFEMMHTGDNGERYFKYTATENIILTITCPEGCLVSGMDGVTKNEDGNYVVTLNAGDAVTLNPWANTADQSADAMYTYTITGEVIVPEDSGDAAGPDGVYLASHGSGRKYQVTIDSAAGTITIVRSDISGFLTTGGATTYTANYSFDGTTVTYDGTYAMEFDSNGAPIKLTWGTHAVTDFVKQ